MNIICSLLFLFVNVVGSIHASLPLESEQDENKRAGQTQRLIDFYENLIAKHKIDESIPSAPEVLFGLKKTQELVATKEFVVSDVPSIGQNAFEKIPPDSAKQVLPSVVETSAGVAKDKSFSFDNSYVNPLQNFRLDKYFGLFEGYAETLRGNCSDFRQIDQY